MRWLFWTAAMGTFMGLVAARVLSVDVTGVVIILGYLWAIGSLEMAANIRARDAEKALARIWESRRTVIEKMRRSGLS